VARLWCTTSLSSTLAEVRDLGVGYFAFSRDEEERSRQRALLDRLREETLEKRRHRQQLRDRRTRQFAARLAAAQARRQAAGQEGSAVIRLVSEAADRPDTNELQPELLENGDSGSDEDGSSGSESESTSSDGNGGAEAHEWRGEDSMPSREVQQRVERLLRRVQHHLPS
jgi:hypothetical protein